MMFADAKSARPAFTKVIVSAAVLGILCFLALMATPRKPFALDTSTSAEPLIIFCSRTIKAGAMDKYKADFTAFSNAMFYGTPGIKAMFSVEDKDAPGTVLQYFHFNSLSVFYNQPQKPALSAALWSNYGGTKESDVCQVFGGWDEQLKTIAATLPGVSYVMKPALAGFIKSSGEGLPGPPIIFVSKRKVQEGKMAAYGTGMQAVADFWFKNVPGLLSGYAYVSDDDPDWVWDLRIMSNWADGFVAHVPPEIFPLIGPWASNVDKAAPYSGMPHAVAFSAGLGDAMIKANPGNGLYTHYSWNEIIGPMPDYTKDD